MASEGICRKRLNHLAGCTNDCIRGAAGSTDCTVQGGLLVQELHGNVRLLKGCRAIAGLEGRPDAAILEHRSTAGVANHTVLSTPENAQRPAPLPAYRNKVSSDQCGFSCNTFSMAVYIGGERLQRCQACHCKGHKTGVAHLPGWGCAGVIKHAEVGVARCTVC